MTDDHIQRLTRKYREAPGTVTEDERLELREAEVINADGDLYEDTPLPPSTD